MLFFALSIKQSLFSVTRSGQKDFSPGHATPLLIGLTPQFITLL